MIRNSFSGVVTGAILPPLRNAPQAFAKPATLPAAQRFYATRGSTALLT